MFILISVVICVIAAVSGAPASPDIEEFIDKLISSDRFELLVEKVAERAVEKLKIMQRGGPPGDKGPRGDPRDGRPNVLRNDEANEKLQTRPKPQKALRGVPGKIDIQAVKEKFGPFGSDKLSLNYKHFTSNKPFQESSKTTERSVPSSPSTSSSPVKMIELSDVRQEKREYKEHSKEMDFTFNKSEEPKKEAVKEEAENSFEHYNKNNDKRIPNKITDEILELNNNSPEHIFKLETYLSRDDNKYSNSPFNSQKQPRAIDTVPAKSSVKHNIMPESLNNNIFRAKAHGNELNDLTGEEGYEGADKGSLSHDDKQTVIEILDQNNSAQHRQRVMVRRENGKLYTFQKSPDYEEYYEALARKKNDNSIEISIDEGNGVTIHS